MAPSVFPKVPFSEIHSSPKLALADRELPGAMLVSVKHGAISISEDSVFPNSQFAKLALADCEAALMLGFA